MPGLLIMGVFLFMDRIWITSFAWLHYGLRGFLLPTLDLYLSDFVYSDDPLSNADSHYGGAVFIANCWILVYSL